MRHAHWIVTALLLLLLVPVFRAANLPLRFAWDVYSYLYWIQFLESVILATVLFAIGYPSALWRHITGKLGPPVSPIEPVVSVVLPGTYLFLLFVLLFSYNDVIATFRFDEATDAALNWMDSRLMGGSIISDFSHNLRPDQFKWLELIYTWMYPQVGACLLIVALRQGRARAMQYVGTIAMAFFIALGLFYFIPATGPFYISVIHGDGGYVGLGGMAAHTLNELKQHNRLAMIGLDYFIAFPCLHLTQPLIVLWFLRESGRIVAFLAAYDLALIGAILLLREHYVVDLVGGICVAVLAIAIVDRSELPTRPKCRPTLEQ